MYVSAYQRPIGVILVFYQCPISVPCVFIRVLLVSISVYECPVSLLLESSYQCRLMSVAFVFISVLLLLSLSVYQYPSSGILVPCQIPISVPFAFIGVLLVSARVYECPITALLVPNQCPIKVLLAFHLCLLVSYLCL